MNLDNLVPFKEKHSIREAAVSFFLINPIIKPEEFSELKKQDDFDFQKFEIIQRQGIKISGGTNQEWNTQPISPANIGFRFEKFGREGQITDVLTGTSQDDSGHARLSFHDLDYLRWHAFLEKSCKYIKKITKFRTGFFATAFSLNYIDEFTWKGDKDIPIADIFDKDSEFLPSVFFERRNSIYTIVTQKETDVNSYYERLEIKVDENRAEPLIMVNHSVTQPLSEIIRLEEFVNDDSQIELLESAHTYNKFMLQSILTHELRNKINLTDQETHEQPA